MDLGLIQDLIKESDLRDLPLGEVLLQPFFYGVIKPTTDGFTVIEPPACDPKAIRRRLEDARFCRYCFGFDGMHYMGKCRNSGWT